MESSSIAINRTSAVVVADRRKKREGENHKQPEEPECTKAKISLIGIRRRKSGRYSATITDPIKHKEVYLGTFDTIEQASQAYFSKKSELEKLSQQGNKEDKSKRNCDPHKTTTHIVGAHKRGGRYTSEIRNPITKKKIWLGTFDTAEEASQAYLSKKSEFENEKLRQQGEKENTPTKNFDQLQAESPVVETLTTASMGRRRISIDAQGKEPGSSKATSGLMANVRGAESSDECNVTTSCDPKAMISLIGISRRKSGRYSATITDPNKHKKVYLGTFDTIEQASQAYFSKKSEFEKNYDPHKTKTHIIGVHKRKATGRYTSAIKNPITKERIWLGTFDTAEEASRAYQSKKLEFQKLEEVKQQHYANKHTRSKKDGKSGGGVNIKQGHEALNCHERFQPKSAGGSEIDVPVSNSTEGTGSQEIGIAEDAFHVYQSKNKQVFSCLMVNAHGKESSDECNITTSWNTKARRSFVGIKRQTDGRYAAVITDRVKHRKLWFDTFETIEEASQAYLSKKSEFEKLSQQGKKEKKPKRNCDQILHESPVVKTLNTTSMGRRNARIDSQGKEPRSSEETSSDEGNTTTRCDPKSKRSLIGIRRRKSGRYATEITDPIRHKSLWLGTFDTVEEASQAYLSKKSESEKLSQGNKEDRSKKNCDQVQQPESSPVGATSLSVDTHIVGAHKRTRRYTSEIKNPISKKRIWLGSFRTAEEASWAYQSKKLEFQKLVNAKQQQYANKHTHSKQDGKSGGLVNVKEGHEDLNCELKSAGGSEINVPNSNSFSGGTNQRINSHETGAAEEAFHAYLSKKFDSKSSKEVELQGNMSTGFSAGKNQEGQVDDKDLWMGKWVQLPGDRAVMFSIKLGLPIIDNYGSLLGEFSSLDDLSMS